MIEIGKRQTLTIVKKTDFGVYLADTLDKDRTREDEVLLPKKEVTPDLDVMDPVNVFIYRDSQDRLIATTKDPLIHLGEISKLVVKDVNNVGAFLDWGLEKDLLLPYKQQRNNPQKGDEVSVRLYVDKSKRLCATMWVSDEEKKQSSYEKNASKLLAILRKNKGFLPINDKSDPEVIKDLTGMSKNEFKKAVGNLYKQRKLSIEDDGITLNK